MKVEAQEVAFQVVLDNVSNTFGPVSKLRFVSKDYSLAEAENQSCLYHNPYN